MFQIISREMSPVSVTVVETRRRDHRRSHTRTGTDNDALEYRRRCGRRRFDALHCTAERSRQALKMRREVELTSTLSSTTRVTGRRRLTGRAATSLASPPHAHSRTLAPLPLPVPPRPALRRARPASRPSRRLTATPSPSASSDGQIR
ncbi:hypothetical protein RR48_14631 [Papilio machaon]|uniref:Uncharacterized protein n=1 Tax=Papilio machaon TaxID=76193 RepID=A0A194QLD4_PAPMA|nr:hypothetical protein RR48_14631 [Papilio machaon]